LSNPDQRVKVQIPVWETVYHILPFLYNAPTCTISATRTTAIIAFRQTAVRNRKRVTKKSETKSVPNYLLI
jgi:hypothetical protein